MSNSTLPDPDQALDIDSLLALVEEYFQRRVGGTDDSHGTAYYQGLALAVDKARKNALSLYTDICKLDEANPYEGLTKNQKATISALIDDIVEGNVDAFHTKDSDSARIALARIEATTDGLSLEEIAQKLDALEFDVMLDLNSDGHYQVSKTWTLGGLRHVLAREQFVNSVLFESENQEPWEATNE